LWVCFCSIVGLFLQYRGCVSAVLWVSFSSIASLLGFSGLRTALTLRMNYFVQRYGLPTADPLLCSYTAGDHWPI
jgi:hypothetical protein